MDQQSSQYGITLANFVDFPEDILKNAKSIAQEIEKKKNVYDIYNDTNIANDEISINTDSVDNIDSERPLNRKSYFKAYDIMQKLIYMTIFLDEMDEDEIKKNFKILKNRALSED